MEYINMQIGWQVIIKSYKRDIIINTNFFYMIGVPWNIIPPPPPNEFGQLS